MNRTDELTFIIDLAKQAGEIAKQHYGKVLRLTKTHRATQNEAVTDADRACQRLIVSQLRERFPTDGIIGEESDDGSDITADFSDVDGRVWVIDPIDGTNNFVGGADNFAVCIGLLERGMPVLGVVYDVMRDRVYAGVPGEVALVNDKPTRVKETPMDEAAILMMTSNATDKSGHAPEWLRQLVSQTKWKLRMLGTAALESVSVAAGVADAAVTVNGKLWDCVAPAACVLAAGGSITDLAGKPIFPFDLKNYGGAKVPYLSAGPQAVEPMLELMRKNP